jgi:hypothetical protein
MTGVRRAGTVLAVCVAAAAAGAIDPRGDALLSAAGRWITGVELVLPGLADTLYDITPTVLVQAVGIVPDDRPIVLALQAAVSPGFTSPLVLDTSVTGDTVAFALTKPLPGGTTLFFRGSARPRIGGVLTSPTQRRSIPAWVRLVSPDDPNGTTLATVRPRFIWRGVQVSLPPGPFTYELQIRNVGTSRSIFYPDLSDTAFTVPVPLEINTSYRWSVIARLPSGDEESAESQGSFVIVDPAIPLATLLYQNFPNPFPSATATSTCVWFDLNRLSPVRLDVHDLQGRHVRNLIPGDNGPSVFPAGRHGRVPGGGSSSECNGSIRWDGRGSDGRFAPAGVYLLRLRTDATESVKKIVFRGAR